MSYPLPLTRTEAYLAYKAGVIQRSELKPSLSVPRIGIDAWLAYWTGLTNNYPKNPDGTPKMLQEEEKYIAYLCGVTDKYPEKCLRRVGAYLRYLISARWVRPDHPLNREELYLSLLKTQVIQSGDPSSDIVIDGTAKAPFVDAKMYGDTFQQSYEGKNLVNTYDMAEIANSGLTITKGRDGAIILNGSQNKSCNIRLDATDYFSGLVGENFTISVSTSGTGKWTNFGFKTPVSTIVPAVTPTIPTRTVTLKSSSSGEYWFELYIENSGTVFKDYKLYIQVEKGSTATSYEPYVGGQPSPNLDYPQPIQTVTGSQTVEIVGNNLFDGFFEFGNISPTTGVDINDDNMIRSKNYAVIEGGENYTISVVGGGNVALRFYQSNGTFIGTGTTVASPNTFTAPVNAGRVRFIVESNTNLSTKAQCEKGSSATTWNPYSKQTYTLNLGSIELCKLGDYQDYIWKDGEDWKVHKDIGKYQFNGSEPWIRSGNTTPDFFVAVIGTKLQDYLKVKDRNSLKSAYFIQHNPLITSGQMNAYNGTNTAPIAFALSFDAASITNITDAVTWIRNNKPTVYSAINNPTDTVITNQNLINQLNALMNGGAEDGTTYIKVSATDSNLPGLLYVEAPKYE